MSNENKLLGKKLQEMREQLQTLPNDVIVMALEGGVDVNQLLHEVLAGRGWSAKKNHWVGTLKASAEYTDRWGEDPEF